MRIKEFCEKYQITPQAIYAKIKRKAEQLDSHVMKLGGQLDEKISECEKLKKSLADEISKNENLKVLLNEKTSIIEDLENQLTEQNSKNADFENLAAALKNEILNILEKIDSIQLSISEITKKSSGGLAGLLKK